MLIITQSRENYKYSFPKSALFPDKKIKSSEIQTNQIFPIYKMKVWWYDNHDKM